MKTIVTTSVTVTFFALALLLGGCGAGMQARSVDVKEALLVNPLGRNVLPLVAPGALVFERTLLEIRGRRIPVVDPLAQLLAAVDQVDREPLALIFVGKITPQVVGPVDAADRLECDAT